MALCDFETIIANVKVETLVSSSPPPQKFYLYANVLDSSKLRVLVTDFKFNTWVVTKSVIQLESVRDMIGIAGPWYEFVDYLVTSLKSENVKIVFEGQSEGEGPAYAKLTAQKSGGFPLLTLPLNKLVGVAATEATGDFSQELFKGYKSYRELLAREQTGRYQLTATVAAEQEKSKKLHRELDLLRGSKRQRSLQESPVMLSRECLMTKPTATLPADNLRGENDRDKQESTAKIQTVIQNSREVEREKNVNDKEESNIAKRRKLMGNSSRSEVKNTEKDEGPSSGQSRLKSPPHGGTIRQGQQEEISVARAIMSLSSRPPANTRSLENEMENAEPSLQVSKVQKVLQNSGGFEKEKNFKEKNENSMEHNRNLIEINVEEEPMLPTSILPPKLKQMKANKDDGDRTQTYHEVDIRYAGLDEKIGKQRSYSRDDQDQI